MQRKTLEATMIVQRDSSAKMGADRVRLLEAIQEHGSISAAANHMGLSYKAAWDAVNTMNNLFGKPLVSAASGGRDGGRAALTAAGSQVLSAFSSVQAELARFLDLLQARVGTTDTSSTSIFLWSLLMKTSARNMFRCTVKQVVDGAVNAEILLDLAADLHLAAIITRRSVAELGIVPGREVFALVKSSFVILAPEEGLGKTSARNRLCGTVISRQDGEVNSEFIIDIGGGKTIAAIITKASAEAMGLALGDRACALIKASHVILAVE